MELTRRLLKITSFVEKGMSVADIGCDHGYVPIYLVKEGISPKAIAMDINRGPLEKAKNNSIAYKVGDKIKVRQSNGLEQLKESEVDCVIIAGMGGKLIEELLEKEKNKLRTYKRFILSPHKDLSALRAKLQELDIIIVDETMLYEEGHYYNIIVAQPIVIRSELELNQQTDFEKNNHLLEFDEDEEKLHKIYNKYGKILIEHKNPFLEKQLTEFIHKQERLLAKLKDKAIKGRVMELTEEINEGKKVLSWLRS